MTDTPNPPNPPTVSEDDGLPIPEFLRQHGDKNAPLPSWVMTQGTATKREWVSPQGSVAKPHKSIQTHDADGNELFQKITGAFKASGETKVVVAKEPSGRPRSKGRPGTRAETVREYIREAMAKGETPESVMLRARHEPLNMRETEAARYVTENWAHVLKVKQG